jgi:hypothetical protein
MAADTARSKWQMGGATDSVFRVLPLQGLGAALLANLARVAFIGHSIFKMV